MRGSTNIVDVDGDGQLEIIVPDMMGTLTILDLDGREQGQINMNYCCYLRRDTPLVLL